MLKSHQTLIDRLDAGLPHGNSTIELTADDIVAIAGKPLRNGPAVADPFQQVGDYRGRALRQSNAGVSAIILPNGRRLDLDQA